MDRGGLRLASRGRERSWWLLVVAIIAAVLVALITRINGAPAWVQLTCLAVGTGLGLLVVELRARRAQDDKTVAVVRENVADASQTLRRMREVEGEDAGVHRATQDVDYVRREVESAIERQLRAERRVLIIGPSMSGKTRLALQMTKHLYADHRLLVPKDGQALHALLAAGVTGTGLVVWLDDLDHYLGSDGLTTDVLDRFHEQRNVVVATIRSTAYEALLVPTGDLRPAGWEVPGWFGDPVWLSRQTWDAALEHADPGDLVSVGYQAAVEHGQLDVAETAFRRSAAHGNPQAMSNLGVLLARRGESTEAEQWYRRAAGLNVPEAMTNLGGLLARRGESTEAEQWYRKAADVERSD